MRTYFLLIFFLSASSSLFAKCNNSEEASLEFSKFMSTLHQQSNLSSLNTFIRLAPEGCLEHLKSSPELTGQLRHLTTNHLRAVAKGTVLNIEDGLKVLEQIDTSRHILNDSDMKRSIASIKGFLASRTDWCTHVDLREKMPPIRNQRDSRWCFSFTAADIISHKYDVNVSAIDVAMQNNRAGMEAQGREVVGSSVAAMRDKVRSMDVSGFGNELRSLLSNMSNVTPPSARGGGLVPIAMIGLQRNGGFCLESDMPSENYSQSKSVMEIVSLTQKMDEVYRSQKIVSGEDVASANLVDTFCGDGGASLRSAFPNILPADVLNILRNEPSVDLFYDLVSRQCKNRKEFNFESYEEYLPSTSVFGLSAGINDALDATPPIPAALGYYPQFLKGGIKIPGDSTAHSSSIVGRRWNEESGQCQYMIRNSWGSDCTQYAPEYSRNCEDGNIWVNESTIELNGINVEVFK